jgi:hypothetical protein
MMISHVVLLTGLAGRQKLAAIDERAVQKDSNEFEYIAHDDHYPSLHIEGELDNEGPHSEYLTSPRNYCEDYNVFGAATSKGRHSDEDYRPTPPPNGERQGSMLDECIRAPEAEEIIQDISCEFIHV